MTTHESKKTTQVSCVMLTLVLLAILKDGKVPKQAFSENKVGRGLCHPTEASHYSASRINKGRMRHADGYGIWFYGLCPELLSFASGDRVKDQHANICSKHWRISSLCILLNVVQDYF